MGQHFVFGKDVRRSRRLRLAIAGHSKAGKSWTSLTIATGIVKYLREHDAMTGNGRIAVIDTEHQSSLDYRNDFDFDPGFLSYYDPKEYIAAINEVAKMDYTVLVIDQISHAWAGAGGILEQHAAATAASRSKNGFVQWQKHGAMLNALIEAILAYPHHTICTMRAKVKYRQDKDGTVSKIGTRPIQRNEIEFEFTGMGRMTSDHCLEFDGSRCQAINHRKFLQPDASLGEIFGEWIVAGRVEQELPLSLLDARLVQEIQQLSRKLGMGQDDMIDVLARRGVSRIEDLPLPRAQEIIRAMKSRIHEEERKAARATQEEEGAAESASSEPQARPAPDPAPVHGTAVGDDDAPPTDMGDELVSMLASQAPPPTVETVPDTREEKVYRAKCLAEDLGYDRDRWLQHLAAVGADPAAPDVGQLTDDGLDLLTAELEELTRLKAEDPAEYARVTTPPEPEPEPQPKEEAAAPEPPWEAPAPAATEADTDEPASMPRAPVPPEPESPASPAKRTTRRRAAKA